MKQSCRECSPPALQKCAFLARQAFENFLHKRVRIIAIGLIALFGVSGKASVNSAFAQQITAIDREYTIKAEFLYHFLTYIEWPAEAFSDSKQPFVIGVFETDPFGPVLDKIAATKNVAGRPIEIRRLASTDKLLECHIVFVAKGVAPALQKQVLELVADSHVLCVGETEDFVNEGGAAHFFAEGNKIRFAFNTDVVDRSNLKVSSKLLSLAKIVSTH